jgi:AraC family transcriptional regulator
MVNSDFDPFTLDVFARQLLPDAPEFTSRDTDLRNIFLLHYLHSPWELPEHTIPAHVLEVLSPQAKTHHQRRLGDQICHSELTGGECFFYPAGVGHSVRWEQELEFSLLVFAPQFFEEELGCNPADVVPFMETQQLDLQYLTGKLLRDIQSGCPYGSLYSDTYALALGLEIVKHLRTGSPSTGSSFNNSTFDGLSSHNLKQVQDLIHTKVRQGEHPTLAEMARMAGVSQSHFTRLFKASTGKAPHAYYDELRMQLALELLQTTNQGIATIACLCGFNDQSYFSRRFRQYFGVSPSQFRVERGNTSSQF